MAAMMTDAVVAAISPLDLDADHEPGGHQQRQSHEDDRQDRRDDDVVDPESQEDHGPHEEGDGARQQCQEQSGEDVTREADADLDARHQPGHEQQGDGVDEQVGEPPRDEMPKTPGPVDERVVLVSPDGGDAMRQPGPLGLRAEALLDAGALGGSGIARGLLRDRRHGAQYGDCEPADCITGSPRAVAGRRPPTRASAVRSRAARRGLRSRAGSRRPGRSTAGSSSRA